MTKWLIQVQWCVSKASWNKQNKYIVNTHLVNEVNAFAFRVYCCPNWAASLVDHLCNIVNMWAASYSTQTIRHTHNSFKWRDYATQSTGVTRVVFFLPPPWFNFQRDVLTHLECYREHQHGKDESPEGPVPKHLQGKRGRRRLVATSIRHPCQPAFTD